MRVLHFTDVHLTVPFTEVTLSEWMGKRVLGGLNHRLRRARYFADVPHKLARLAEFVTEQGIELVLSTGDHTLLGTEAEYRAARGALEPFLQAPSGFVHVPGNHDLYLGDTLRERRFERYFGETLRSDCPEYQVDGPWPVVRLVGELVAVVAVNSARPNPEPWRSSGLVPPSELEVLGRVLGDPRVAERFVFVLTHFAPLRADGRPDSRSHGLVNGAELLRVCASLERGALLAGHIHHCYRVKVPGLKPRLYNAGSTTCAGREGLWLFDVSEREARATRGRWSGDRYVLDPDESFPC
jgi:3',5'-cyclic AMP phosphodiesterase CpdA